MAQYAFTNCNLLLKYLGSFENLVTNVGDSSSGICFHLVQKIVCMQAECFDKCIATKLYMYIVSLHCCASLNITNARYLHTSPKTDY